MLRAGKGARLIAPFFIAALIGYWLCGVIAGVTFGPPKTWRVVPINSAPLAAGRVPRTSRSVSLDGVAMQASSGPETSAVSDSAAKLGPESPNDPLRSSLSAPVRTGEEVSPIGARFDWFGSKSGPIVDVSREPETEFHRERRLRDLARALDLDSHVAVPPWKDSVFEYAALLGADLRVFGADNLVRAAPAEAVECLAQFGGRDPASLPADVRDNCEAVVRRYESNRRRTMGSAFAATLATNSTNSQATPNAIAVLIERGRLVVCRSDTNSDLDTVVSDLRSATTRAADKLIERLR